MNQGWRGVGTPSGRALEKGWQNTTHAVRCGHIRTLLGAEKKNSNKRRRLAECREARSVVPHKVVTWAREKVEKKKERGSAKGNKEE